MDMRSGLFVAALSLASCSGWDDARTLTVDGYSVALKFKPVVGQKALLKLKLARGEKELAACRVVIRQLMAGMEMSSDSVETAMAPEGDGVYTATSAEFGMGGDWRIEVKFNCGAGEYVAVFNYNLEWPE